MAEPTQAPQSFFSSSGSFINSFNTQYQNAVRVVCKSDGTSAGWAGADVSVWIANAQADLPAGGGTVDASSCFGAQTISQEIAVGNSSSKPVLLKLPNFGTWTATMTGGTAYALKVFNKSSAIGSGSGQGQPFVIQAGASSNLDTVCGSNPSSFGYFRMEGFSCSAVAGATVVNAILNIQKTFDVSYVGKMTAITNSASANKVFWAHGLCCGTKIEVVSAEGNNTAGAIPCTWGESGVAQTSLNIDTVSCVHPGSGQSNVNVIQTGAQSSAGNHYANIYTEVTSADLTTPVIAVTGSSGYLDLIENVSLGADVASSTRYLVDVANNASVMLRNLSLSSVSPNAINDHTASRGTLSPGAFATVKEYLTSSNALHKPAIAGGTFGTSPSFASYSLSSSGISMQINVGTGGTATGGTVNMPGTANGWNCSVSNQTAHASNRADDTVQTSTTGTTVVVQNQTKSTGAALAWLASDIVNLTCQPR
jgi:hypothetical protein